MSASLNNIATADRYTEANTLHCPGAELVTIAIRNAAVYLEYGEGIGSPKWTGVEIFTLPSDRSLGRQPGRPLDAVRVRSAKAATPAQVTMEAA